MIKFFLVFLLLSSFFSAYSQKVKGIITDVEGNPLPYASVFVKNTGKGTNANSEGKYSLKLAPGKYTLACQYVGYKKEEISISINNDDQEINFILKVQETVLGEVVLKNGEDPAYQIIRNTIKKRTYYLNQPEAYECMVYTKGQLRVRNYPNKILGRTVDFEDGDTSKRKMLYLSETISKYSSRPPDKVKVEVVSSKVSGQSDGYGLSAPQFFSFYENNISIGNNLNPRGFISPISDNALNYYRYKFEGSFFEDNNLISRIKVIPKRKYEPLFSGYINIVEDDWRIHSVQLELTKQSQMEILDTLRIEQLYIPLDKDTWFISSQVIYPSIKIFGFDAYGSFVNIYSDINVDPSFTKKTFNNTILKYTDSSNRRTKEYWEKNRPIPLLTDEQSDYRKKDSLEQLRKDPAYIDSLDRRRNKINIAGLFLLGQTFTKERKRTSVSIAPLIDQVNFNPAEGWVISTGFKWTKKLDSISFSRKQISIEPNFRYGFLNKHFNPNLTLNYVYGKKYASSISLSGGKRVFQFNNNSPIGERGNTISSLLSEENRFKSYEATYFRGSYRKNVGDGFSIVGGFQYQDRSPLNNLTDYTWNDKDNREYTPNYPFEISTENIKRHQSFTTLIGLSWQPGVRYIEFPDRKISLGSKYPLMSVQLITGHNKIFGSDADFSKWKFNVKDDINLKLKGVFNYRIGIGGFISNKKVELPDYNHFNGNISTLATETLNSFQLLPIYQYSNTDKFYSLAHIEYNLKGFLTNKIPGFRKLNLYLVTGGNGFYINNSKYYYELFVGLDNIFKQLRVDFVQSYLDGRRWQNGFRIGLSRLGGRRGDDWP